MADVIPPPPGYVLQMRAALPPPPDGYVLSAPVVKGNANYSEDVPYADGTSPFTLGDLMPEAMAPERPKTVGDRLNDAKDVIVRGAELGIRSPVRGVTQIPDLVIAPGAALIDKGLETAGVDPKYWQGGPKSLTEMFDQGWHEAGLPVPETPGERIVDRIGEGLGGVAVGAGAGAALGGARNAAAQVIGRSLEDNLAAQSAASAAGAATSGAVHEAGASPNVELAAALTGGLSPALLAGSAQGVRAGASALLGRADEQTAALAARAQELGIPLKVSQVADSRFGKTLDSVARGVPFSGAGKFNEAQQVAFNRAVGRTIGEDVDKITPEVFDRAMTRVGGEYDRLAEATKIPLGPDLGRAITAIADEARDFLGPQAQKQVLNVKQRLVDQSVNGVLPGQAFQSIDSALGKVAGAGGENAYILGKLQETLRDAAEASLSPEDAQALAMARQQYRDLKTIEPLVASTGAASGNISPAALQGRVTATKAGKASMARGSRGDLGDLAAVGQRFIKEPPNSFTADRQQARDVLKTVGGAILGGGVGSAFGPYVGTAGALLTGGSAVGAARLSQRINQSRTLLDAMLGNGPTLDPLRRGIAASTAPTLIQAMQQAGN